ncbi:MAG: hypothetical protein HQL54_10700 [Magnetococcales bacterium]|nr:hypothetical protein [Magnetococcales bacterium]
MKKISRRTALQTLLGFPICVQFIAQSNPTIADSKHYSPFVAGSRAGHALQRSVSTFKLELGR